MPGQSTRSRGRPPAGPGATCRPVSQTGHEHDLDRAAQQLRDRFAYRPARRGPAEAKWAWTDTAAQACEASIRETLGDVTRPAVGDEALERRARAAIATARHLLGADTTAACTPAADSGCCGWCGGPLPKGLRPEAKFCSKRCRQAASRARLKVKPPLPPSPPPEKCGWCGGPMPEGLRAEARYCGKRCRQASSRFGLAVKRTAPTTAPPPGPGDVSRSSPMPAGATRRGRPRREVLDDVSRSMRFAYADPPYPGKAGYYPEQAEVDHGALVERLVAEFEDGWALSTSAEALQEVLALCPAGVRVCAWQRAVRPTRSKRPISAWEPLIVYRGRELPLDQPQTVRDALAYGGRYRAFPGALTGMKPPQFAVWMFCQLGARPGDELVDLYPGSGAIGEAWRRYTAAADDASRVDAGARAASAARPRAYDVAPGCSEQAIRCPVNGARCDQVACIDEGCAAEDAKVDAERAA